jgi:hypothetical protein
MQQLQAVLDVAHQPYVRAGGIIKHEIRQIMHRALAIIADRSCPGWLQLTWTQQTEESG